VNTLKKQDGFSLIEIVLLIVLMGIAIPPLAHLMKINLISSGKLSSMSKTSFYAQQRMEQVIADYTANGYTALTTNGRYSTQTVGGVTTSVSITASTWTGINYATVTISASIPNVPGSYFTVVTCLPQGL